MFIEVSKKTFEKLKKKLDEMGIEYTVSDCKLPNEKNEMVHLETSGLDHEQVKAINDFVAVYGEQEMTIDRDGDGVADLYQKEPPVLTEKRHRKWDDRMHTLGEEAIGEITGANREEEVTYEQR